MRLSHRQQIDKCNSPLCLEESASQLPSVTASAPSPRCPEAPGADTCRSAAPCRSPRTGRRPPPGRSLLSAAAASPPVRDTTPPSSARASPRLRKRFGQVRPTSVPTSDPSPSIAICYFCLLFDSVAYGLREPPCLHSASRRVRVGLESSPSD
jgi:hypothetical protein